MRKSKINRVLNKVSGASFGIGGFMSGLTRIPILSQIVALPSLLFFFAGYITWLANTYFYKDYDQEHDTSYGFTTYKGRCQTAALLGAIAILLSIIVPVLFVPTAWLLFIGNFVWIHGERNKKDNPPQNDPEAPFQAG